ncbi:MAG TPA: hypothetical protein VK927_00375, partial [Adhaeribacter sp.]|nr:hypothetical protein [Adhaeribacter sp.]
MAGRFLLSLLFLLTALQAQAQYQDLLHKTYAQRYLAQEKKFYTGSAMSQDSSVFFKELEKLAQAADQAGHEELLLESRLLRAEYYMYGRQTNHKAFEP